MKFQNLASFEKHLHASSVVSTYIVACSDSDERSKILASIAEWLCKKYPESEVLGSLSSSEKFQSIIENLSTQPLFSSHIIVGINDGSDFSKKERAELEGFITKPSKFAFLVMGASSLKDFSAVCNTAKNDIVVLDLSQEKTWDRQRRLQQWLIDRCIKEGKKISQGVASEILDACGPDIMLLEQELLKIIAYIGASPSISSEDVKNIGVNYVLPTGWNMAESLVWEAKAPIKDPSFSLSDLLPLLGQVRYHLQLLRQFAVYLSQGQSREEISAHFPQVRQNSFDKCMQLACSHNAAYFDEALKCLFKIDLLSKNSSLSADFLWDYLVSQIAQKKAYYAKKSPSHFTSQRA
ncbi:MAG: hypothetical protein NTX49_07680 [Chlamydiae bacterium]|nr:hypothetical protein [Chlamydiota bacterium]